MTRGDNLFNARDWQALEDVHHPDMIAFIPGSAEPIYGREAHGAAMQQLVRMFTDVRVQTPYPEAQVTATRLANHLADSHADVAEARYDIATGAALRLRMPRAWAYCLVSRATATGAVTPLSSTTVHAMTARPRASTAQPSLVVRVTLS